MIVARTDRLTLRRFTLDDAGFILTLLNQPTWLEFIGDRNVRTLDDAVMYLATGPLESYARHGYGLYLVERAGDGAPVGLCGLVRRAALDAPDVGFAFLDGEQAQGYGFESARAVLDHARDLGLPRVLAITTEANTRSIGLLTKLGLRYDRLVQLAEDGPELQLYVSGAA